MTLQTDFYQAVDAIRVALKAAIDDPNFDESQLSEVWRHYLGMKAIYKSLPSAKIEFQQSSVKYEDIIKCEGLDDQPIAAGFVNIPGGMGEDAISFGDYKSQEYRFD